MLINKPQSTTVFNIKDKVRFNSRRWVVVGVNLDKDIKLILKGIDRINKNVFISFNYNTHGVIKESEIKKYEKV